MAVLTYCQLRLQVLSCGTDSLSACLTLRLQQRLHLLLMRVPEVEQSTGLLRDVLQRFGLPLDVFGAQLLDLRRQLLVTNSRPDVRQPELDTRSL